jgi:hypothetical protein
MKKLLIALTAVTIMAAPALADYTEDRTLEIDADDVRILRIDCGAGFLEIEGVDGMKTIQVDAEIILDDVSDNEAQDIMEDYMELELTASGRNAKLVSKFENRGFLSQIFHGGNSALINLTVRVPKNIELRIDDGSGYIEVINTGDDIALDDGSGDIVFENVAGDIRIDDGSGNVELQGIKGDIELDDGSGNVEISDVTGDVEIDDGSGNIYVSHIDGSVIVDDGSGNIKITRITEDVRIIDDGSGRCSITHVDGDIDR